MGFGYGHKTSHNGQAINRETGERVASRFSNDMVAHVWAQRTQTFGQSGNGNLYFEGDGLYSYGSHFLVAYLLDIGKAEPVALLNGDSYSSTTSQHKSDASGAVRHFTRYTVPELTKLRDVLPTLADYAGKPAKLRREAEGEEGYRAKQARREVAEWLRSFNIAEDSEVTSRDGSYSWTREGNAAGAYAIARAAGYRDSEVRRFQRERAAKLAKDKASRERYERERLEREAKHVAAMADSDFRASWPNDGDRQWTKGDSHGKPYGVEQGERFSAKLLRLQRTAKAKGWTRIAAQLSAKRKAYREHFAGRNARILQDWRNQQARNVRRWRAGDGARPNGALFARFPAIQRAIARSERLERAEKSAAEFAAWQAGERARPYLANYEPDSPEWAAIADSTRAELQALIGTAREWLAEPERLAGNAPRTPYGLRASLEGYDSDKALLAELDSVMAEVETETRRRAHAETFARQKREREDWLAGIANGWRGTDELGGALMRVRGDQLETSQGASVPLAHAVKVFRFVKLCRERGESWQRNGRTIRVGHFQLDSIDSAGNFRAGCHSFNWPEVERVAAIAGVADAAPSAEVVETRELA